MADRSRDKITIRKISQVPEDLEDTSSMEFILVIEDSDNDGGSQLSNNVKLISDHLEVDAQQDQELDDIEEDLLYLSEILKQTDKKDSNQQFRSQIESLPHTCKIHCCAICRVYYKGLSELEIHASNELHRVVEITKFDLLVCKLCSTAPFMDPDLFRSHFVSTHKAFNCDIDLEKYLDKVHVVQMFSPNPVDLLQRIQTLGNGVLLPPDPFQAKNGPPLNQTQGQNPQKLLPAKRRIQDQSNVFIKRAKANRTNQDECRKRSAAGFGIGSNNLYLANTKSGTRSELLRSTEVKIVDLKNSSIRVNSTKQDQNVGPPQFMVDDLIDDTLTPFRTSSGSELRDGVDISQSLEPNSKEVKLATRIIPFNSSFRRRHSETKLPESDQPNASPGQKGFLELSSILRSTSHSIKNINLAPVGGGSLAQSQRGTGADESADRRDPAPQSVHVINLDSNLTLIPRRSPFFHGGDSPLVYV